MWRTPILVSSPPWRSRGAHNLGCAVRKEPYHLTGPLHYTKEVYLLLNMMRRGFWEHNWDMAANHMRLLCVNRSINNAYPKTSEEMCLSSSAIEPRLFNTCLISKFTCMFKCKRVSILCKNDDLSMPAFECFFSLFFSTAKPQDAVMRCLPASLQPMLRKIENKPHWMPVSVKMWIHCCGRLFCESQICAGGL